MGMPLIGSKSGVIVLDAGDSVLAAVGIAGEAASSMRPWRDSVSKASA